VNRRDVIHSSSSSSSSALFTPTIALIHRLVFLMMLINDYSAYKAMHLWLHYLWFKLKPGSTKETCSFTQNCFTTNAKCDTCSAVTTWFRKNGVSHTLLSILGVGCCLFLCVFNMIRLLEAVMKMAPNVDVNHSEYTKIYIHCGC